MRIDESKTRRLWMRMLNERNLCRWPNVAEEEGKRPKRGSGCVGAAGRRDKIERENTNTHTHTRKTTYHALIQFDETWPPVVVDDDDACCV